MGEIQIEIAVSAPPKVDFSAAAKNDHLRRCAPTFEKKNQAKKLFILLRLFVEISVTPISTLARTTSDPALKSGTFQANLSHSMQIAYAG